MPYDRTKFVTNTAVEGLCFDFMQEATDFVADGIFTPKPVTKADNKVYQADTSKLRRVDTKSSTGSAVKLIDEQLFPKNFSLDEYKLGKEINPRIVRDADLGVMFGEGRAAKIVTQGLLIDREGAAATLATTTSNYATGLFATAAAGDRWDNGGDPEAQKQSFDTAVQGVSGLKRLNAVLMDIKVLRALRSNSVFVDRTKYTNGGPVDLGIIKSFLDVDFIFVGGSSYDSANEGAAVSIASPWGKDVVFFYHNPSAGLEDVSFGHMYMAEKPFWTRVDEDPNRAGPAGAIKVLQVGTEYKLDKGYIQSASSDKFAAGYLLKAVIS